MAAGRFMVMAWRGVGHALTPLAPALVGWRRRRGKEHPARWPERLGKASLPRPEGPLVWLHGASVGETTALTPLVAALTADGTAALVTSGTVTSAKMLATRLPAGAMHQFAPLDLPRMVDRFLDHWRPQALVLAESELWPTMLDAARRRDAGLPYSQHASIAKLVCTDAAMKVTTDAVQVFGGAGYTRDYRVERYMREAKITQIFEGTNQIQRLVIARGLTDSGASR